MLINIAGVFPYGPLSKEGENLVEMRQCALFAAKIKIVSLVVIKNTVQLSFDASFGGLDLLFVFLNGTMGASSVLDYKVSVLKYITKVELFVNKGVILNGSYLKLLLERLVNVAKK